MRVHVGAFALPVYAACSALVDLDARNEPTPVVDAGRQEAGGPIVDASAPDAAPVTCPLPQLLSNKGFEAELAAWSPNGITMPSATAGAARTGRFGLRFCSQASNATYSVSQDLVVAALPINRLYSFRAWIRKSENTDAGAGLVTGLQLTYGFNADVGRFTIPSSTWTCVERRTELHSGSAPNYTQAAITIEGSPSQSTCIEVDDVELVEVPDGGLPDGCGCPFIP
jgi:hypothetical protein